jgi:hypothetical protein
MSALDLLTPQLIQAGRAMLDWTQADLASAAALSEREVANLETLGAARSEAALGAAVMAFFNAGVRFGQDGPIRSMDKVDLYLMSGRTGAELRFEYSPGAAAEMRHFLSVFGTPEDDGDVSIQEEQCATPELKARIDQVVADLARRAPPIHQVKQFVRRLAEGEYFLLLRGPPGSTVEQLAQEERLHRLNYPDALDTSAQTKAVFGALLDTYEMTWWRTDKLTVIADKPRARRRCRFCDRTVEQEASFNSVAHAIPTALGNDHLKLAEECDDCNGYFGRETEPSLIALFDMFRAVLGTQGRGKNSGRPELKYANGKLFHDGQKLNIQARAIEEDANGAMTIALGPGASMVPVSVYRALVKIVLSVLPDEELAPLRRTIEWLRWNKHDDVRLPRVSSAVIPLPPNPSAQIVVYRRKQASSTLPHIIGEFRLGCFIYAFAVPLSERDEGDLVGFFDTPEFRAVFKHYDAVDGWKHEDFSGKKKLKLSPILRMEPAGD